MITKLNPGQAGRAIRLCWVADQIAVKMGMPFRVSCALVGGVGSGKTQAVHQFYDWVVEQIPDFEFFKIDLSRKQAAEIGGIPFPDPDGIRYRYLAPPEIPFDRPNVRGVFLADEIDRAGEDTLNAYLEIPMSGRIHGFQIPKGIYNVAALNGNTDIHTTPLSEAARTRMCFIYVSQEDDSSYMEWSESVGIPEVIRDFRRYAPELMHNPDIDPLAIDCSRTRDMAGMLFLARDRVKFKTDDIFLAVIEGTIGRVSALKLLSMADAKSRFPSYEDIMRNPESVPIPENLGLMNAVKDGYVSRVNDYSDASYLAQFIRRLPNEARDVWARELFTKKQDYCPDWVKTLVATGRMPSL